VSDGGAALAVAVNAIAPMIVATIFTRGRVAALPCYRVRAPDPLSQCRFLREGRHSQSPGPRLTLQPGRAFRPQD
jgi:hypothetical protein